jgi:cytochrome c biogenesis protein CcmG/thiol:disulfide interchange protein DsbE
MKRFGTLVAIVIVVLLWLAVRHRSGSQGSGTGAKQAPDFALTDLSGQPLRLSNYRGKVVVLDFWATWCEPCKQEIPHLVDLQTKYPQRVQVLGISMDDDDKPVRSFQQQYKMNYPIAVGTSSLADQYGGVLGLPITFVIDGQGRIAKRYIGAADFSGIEAEVQKLL